MRTTEPPAGGAIYVRQGFLCPPNILTLAKIPDEQTRLDEIEAQSLQIQDAWVIPGPVFQWILKQVAELRALKAELGR